MSTNINPKEIQMSNNKTVYDILLNSYDFRYNEITNQLEYKYKWEAEYLQLTEVAINTIWVMLQKLGIKISKTELTQWINSDLTAIYNPFKQYFKSLPEYTPDMPDYIKQLADTVIVSDGEQNLWDKWLEKWMVAVVACAISDKEINQTALVFVGEQGIGKTSWFEKLTPDPLKKYYFGGSINPNNKDTIIQLAECLFINLDELENLNKTDVGNLKEIITKPSVRIRRPYGKTAENMPRRASFMGSVNNIDFLNDPTGSRRWLIFEATKINYKHNIDMNMVYAQALYLYAKETRFWFNSEEIIGINERNERFKAISPENEILNFYFLRCNRNDEAEFELTTLQIISKLSNENPKVRLTPKGIGSALKALNFDRKKKKGLWYWRLNDRPDKPSLFTVENASR